MPGAKQRKIAVMGSRSVGKSSLAIQFAQGQFVDSYDPTIENTFNKTMKIQGQEYEVLVVDTAGQDEYSIFPTQYTIDIDGYVLVYSIDNEKSFEVIQTIHEQLVDLLGNPSFPLVIVGNKRDLHLNRVISEATGKKLAADLKAEFFETSAKDNNCAMDLFTKTIIHIEKVGLRVLTVYSLQYLRLCVSVFRLMATPLWTRGNVSCLDSWERTELNTILWGYI